MTASEGIDRAVPFRLGTEQRFPLDLQSSVPPIWAAYERALIEVWDPEADQTWEGFDVDAYSAEARQAAALVWSHVAWVEFPMIAESEAVLIRSCIDRGVNVDLKYCLSMRAVERARSTDYAHLLAGRLGTYTAGSADTELSELLDVELVREALHADNDLDAYLASRLIGQATIDLRLWEARAHSATSALAHAIGLIARDKARMLDVAWIQVITTLRSADTHRLGAIEAEINRVLRTEERAGKRLPALLTPGEWRDRLLTANSTAAAALLGGVSEMVQRDVFLDAVAELAERFGALGVGVDTTVSNDV